MPIYKYRCPKCQHEWEDLAKFEDSTMDCPVRIGGAGICGGLGVRVPSLPAPAQFNCSMPTYRKPMR